MARLSSRPAVYSVRMGDAESGAGATGLLTVGQLQWLRFRNGGPSRRSLLCKAEQESL